MIDFQTIKIFRTLMICYPTAINIRICDPRFIPINKKIGSKRIKILILYSGRLQISRYISFVDSYRLHRRLNEK